MVYKFPGVCIYWKCFHFSVAKRCPFKSRGKKDENVGKIVFITNSNSFVFHLLFLFVILDAICIVKQSRIDRIQYQQDSNNSFSWGQKDESNSFDWNKFFSFQIDWFTFESVRWCGNLQDRFRKQNKINIFLSYIKKEKKKRKQKEIFPFLHRIQNSNTFNGARNINSIYIFKFTSRHPTKEFFVSGKCSTLV